MLQSQVPQGCTICLQADAYGQWSSDLEHLLHKEACTQQEGSQQPTTNAATWQLMVLWMRMVSRC